MPGPPARMDDIRQLEVLVPIEYTYFLFCKINVNVM
jgi:hypothetical protein